MKTTKSTENKTEKTNVDQITVKDYLNRAQLSGNPLLIANKLSRIYSNSRVNGTTSIILAVLSTAGATSDKSGTVKASLLENGLKVLRDKAFNVPQWKTLKTNYSKIGGNSSSPEKKLGPVVTGLIREIRNGNLVGFSVREISDSETRKLFGFTI